MLVFLLEVHVQCASAALPVFVPPFSVVLVVGFEEPWYTVFEGTASVQVCVGILRGALAGGITLTFDVQSQQAPTDYAEGEYVHIILDHGSIQLIHQNYLCVNATAPDDYTAISEMRSITSITTRQCFDILVVDDDEREHPEKLLVVGSPMFGGNIQFDPTQTEVWIIDGSKEDRYDVLELLQFHASYCLHVFISRCPNWPNTHIVELFKERV